MRPRKKRQGGGGGEGDNGDLISNAPFRRLISHATRERPDPFTALGKNTFFTSLTAPSVLDLKAAIPEICEDSDALELRVDLLAEKDRYSVLRSHQVRMVLLRPPHPTVTRVFSPRNALDH